jgi:hypothetical protein
MGTNAVGLGTVAELYRYPVKSMQGQRVHSLRIGPEGAEGDRSWALIDVATGKLMSAKRWSKLLLAETDDGGITLPDGTRLPFDGPHVDAELSAWLEREVVLRQVDPGIDVSYEMTFDPPDDEAEYFEIPTPPGSFLDLAAVHLVSRQTLEQCAIARPDLNWDVRRFRPNLVIDAPELSSFGEDAWCGGRLRIGSVLLDALQPTVRCAMPLRAQPGLGSQPLLFEAMDGLHANHLGIYLSVIERGTVEVGARVELM